MLNALFTAIAPCGAPTDRNCLTRSPVDLALALFRTSCWLSASTPCGASANS
jgi:hypothetical protein